MHVVVVGAGLSGLQAAAQLTRLKVRVTILEAARRVGGRVRSETIGPGIVAELGAQWVSRRHRRVIALARESGTKIASSTYSGTMLYGPPEPRLAARLDSFRLMAALRAGTSGRGLGNDRVSLAEWLRGRAWSREAAAWMERSLSSDLCANADRVSVLEVQRQIAAVGGLRGLGQAEDFVLEGGASRLVEHLAGAVTTPPFLDWQVTAITQRPDGITVRSGDQEINADHAILAIPPPLLNDIAFAPSLPDARRNALTSFVRGRVVKSVALFAAPWWRGRRRVGRRSGSDSLHFSGIVDGGTTGSSPPLLVGLSTADRAEAAARLDPQARGAEMASVVAALVGAAASPPLAVRSIDWSTEPHQAGGYAARRGPGGWDGAADLFDPFGRVHFAGTEAATEWRSYMEGALAAGERAADSVLGRAPTTTAD